MSIHSENAVNLLPYDGSVFYLNPFLSEAQAEFYFQKLLQTIAWRPDEAMMFGKKITTKRKSAWHGDRAFTYTYSGITKVASPWTDELTELKKSVEQTSGELYNSCLLNLYHDGSEGMVYHSDAEKDLKKNGTIASLSLGAARKFSFKHKVNGERIDILLAPGSLLLMKGETQRHWLHRLPPTKKVQEPRINLTFRTIDRQHAAHQF